MDPKPLTYQPLPLNQLQARAKLAGEWYRNRKITYTEMARLETDAMHGEDSGPVKWQPGREPK